MKVIVAGFPKTGTKSLNAALSRLGYSVYDSVENALLLYEEYGKVFREGWTIEDFRRMYEDVDAVVDVPACYFWEEIHKAFPDAKIILTVREDEDSWFKSFKKQFETQDASYTLLLLRLLSSTTRQAIINVANPTYTTVLGLATKFWIFRKFHFNEALIRLKYRAHNAYVLHTAPRDKLLIYKCSEGWKPLCEFLGVSIPDEPFPHKNIGGSVVAELLRSHPVLLRMKREMMLTSAVLLVLVFFGSYALFTKGPVNLYRNAIDLIGHLWEKLVEWR